MLSPHPGGCMLTVTICSPCSHHTLVAACLLWRYVHHALTTPWWLHAYCDDMVSCPRGITTNFTNTFWAIISAMAGVNSNVVFSWILHSAWSVPPSSSSPSFCYCLCLWMTFLLSKLLCAPEAECLPLIEKDLKFVLTVTLCVILSVHVCDHLTPPPPHPASFIC